MDSAYETWVKYIAACQALFLHIYSLSPPPDTYGWSEELWSEELDNAIKAYRLYQEQVAA